MRVRGDSGSGMARMPYLAFLLKLVVVPAVLAAIVAGAAGDARLGALSFDAGLLLAALLLNQAALALFAARMRSALHVFGVRLGFLQAMRVHLQSMFFFFALPMTVGMEVARFAKIRNQLGDGAPAAGLASALLADRVLGALAALLIAALLLPFMRFEGIRWESAGPWMGWAAAAVAAAGLVLLHGRVRALALQVLAMLRAEHRSLWASLGIAIVTHCAFAAAIYLAARGANIAIGPLQTLFAVSAAMLFVVLPVSFAGVGPVEAANFGVLVGMGLPVEQAGVFAFLVYLAKLVAAIEGAAWEMAEGRQGLRTLGRKAGAGEGPA